MACLLSLLSVWHISYITFGSKASGTLVALIDRIRMLDNDMIRLDQKINTIIEIQNQQHDTFEHIQKMRDIKQV